MINFLENIAQFLEEHRNLLNKHDFNQLYGDARKTISDKYVPIGEMTSIFLKAGLNPLQYMTYIPDSYLKYINDVTSVEIPNNIMLIGRQAFRSCTGLIRVVIPNSVTKILDCAFDSCEKLTNVTIQNSLIELGSQIFEHCNSLTNIRFNGTKKEWEDIVKDPLWKRHSKLRTIECKDGTIELK